MLVIVEECGVRGCERDVDMTRDDSSEFERHSYARYCSDDCRDTDGEDANERAMEDYYGGAGPLTIDEQMAAARAQKEGR